MPIRHSRSVPPPRDRLTELAQCRQRRRSLQHVGAVQVSLHLVHQHEAELVGWRQGQRRRQVPRPLLCEVLACRQLHRLVEQTAEIDTQMYSQRRREIQSDINTDRQAGKQGGR